MALQLACLLVLGVTSWVWALEELLIWVPKFMGIQLDLLVKCFVTFLAVELHICVWCLKVVIIHHWNLLERILTYTTVSRVHLDVLPVWSYVGLKLWKLDEALFILWLVEVSKRVLIDVDGIEATWNFILEIFVQEMVLFWLLWAMAAFMWALGGLLSGVLLWVVDWHNEGLLREGLHWWEDLSLDVWLFFFYLFWLVS